MLLLICAYSIVCIIIRACANNFLNVSFEHNVCSPIEIINQSMLFSICAYSIVYIIIKACAILISRLNGNEHIFFFQDGFIWGRGI